MATMQLSGTELLDRLVGFDTTSHKTNIPLIRFVESYLNAHGVRSELIATADGSKANLFATIGPKEKAGICLSGHTDVVPVVGQDWDTDPFKLEEKNGRFYGRGTTDMKGFLACVLAAVPMFQGHQLKTPIHIAFSYDEEIGCVGVRPMLAEFGRELTCPAVTIVGEPTNMGVVDAHKGPVRWNVAVTGRAAHSSMAHLGVNAITYAGRLIHELEKIEKELMTGEQDARFDPPYTTLQVTEINGGTASNIVPISCEFGFEIRAMPDFDIAAFTNRIEKLIAEICETNMQAQAEEASITLAQTNAVPPFAADRSAGAVDLALQLTGNNQTSAVSYTTEAGLFQDAGAPSVVCGPGDIAQAHTANEWLSIEQFQQCEAFMARLANWASVN